jgi:uncharacterized membrane protein YedE/YeeE
MTATEDKGWNPYLAGGLSGLLLILSVWVSGNYFNVTNAIVRTAGLLEKLFGPERAARMDYFIKYVPKIDWEWMFVVGIVIGSFISATTSGSFQFKAVPDMWERRFGPSRLKRDSIAFVGGMLVMFGARLAGG